MVMKRKLIIFPLVALTASVILSACGSSSSTASSSTSSSQIGTTRATTNGAVTTVNIGIAAQVAQFALPAVASAEKLWPPNLKVNYTVMNSSTDMASIATGKIQLLIASPPQADNAAYTAHIPIKWVASYQDPSDFQMIVRPGITSLADLKGKVIAETAPGATTQYLTEAALLKAGLSPSQYTLDPLGSVPTMISAFIGGSVQAFVLPSSIVQPLLSEVPGSKMLYDFYTQNVPWIGAGVVAYMPWAQTHSAATAAVLKSLSAALSFIHNNPTSAEPIITKFAPGKTQAADNLQFKYLVERTPSTLQPVKLSTLQAMYSIIRSVNNGAGPTSSFAKTMYDNTFIKQALK